MAMDMTEIVREMDPSWHERVLMKMATKYPKEFHAAFSEAVSDNAKEQIEKYGNE